MNQRIWYSCPQVRIIEWSKTKNTSVEFSVDGEKTGMIGRMQVIKGALILFLVTLVSSLILLIVIMQNSFRAMGEFSDLWNTSDTLVHYVSQ
tara:strand:+ start:9933 stop:10208 length:276 start_codon:yes stop_codon:yes gene_type:complete